MRQTNNPPLVFPAISGASEVFCSAGEEAATPSSAAGYLQPDRCFDGGGKAGELLQGINWPERSLGAVQQWPQSLRTALSICLSSRYPICILWGPDRTYFYNDAYTPIVGDKHPWALGELYPKVWPEIWDSVIKPILEGVERTGKASWCDNILLVLRRYGFNEECYFAFSFAPIRVEDGSVGGVFTAITETTLQLVGERRLRTLKDLGARAPEAKSAEDACRVAIQVLAENRHDIPFALFYLMEPDGQRARFVDGLGTGKQHPISPDSVSLASEDGSAMVWPFSKIVQSGAPMVLRDLDERFGPLPGGPWDEPAHTAMVLPIARPGETTPYGFFVAGISPRRSLDNDYEGFLALVASQVATAISNARAYEEARKRAEALAELDRAKTAFFSNVSHEFRTPLTLMIGPLQELLGKRDGDVPPSERELLQLAHRNSLRLLKLVNTMLDFSRIEAGRMQASFEPADLAVATADLAGGFRSAIEKAGLRLVVRCDAIKEPVYVDRDLWEKIVLNLLSNAFKFTFEGEIEVTLAERQGRVELQVRDTGTGIPEHELQNIFTRFHRVAGAQGRTFEGTGIGLALVQELVKLHGGSITVFSQEGRGSVFTVSLPLGKAHLPPDQISAPRSLASTALRTEVFLEEAMRWLPGAAGAEARPADPRAEDHLDTELGSVGATRDTKGTARARIVLADDNADMREYIRRLLGTRYEVVAVPDGQAALEEIHQHRPDLVLADVMMPVRDGFGLLNALRSNPETSGIPVIMLSARAGEESRIEGLQAGADDYLIKPFSGRELLAVVHTRLELARTRTEAAARIASAHERMRTALNAARLVAWDLDLITGTCTQEGAFLKELGLTEGSEGAYMDLIFPEDRGRVTEAVLKASRGEIEFDLEFRLLTHSGRVYWVRDCAKLLRDSGGQAVRLSGILMDVTELRQVEHRLAAVLSSINDHLATYDRQWRYTYVNEQAARVLGCRPEDLLGRCIWELFPEAVGNRYYEECHRALAEQRIIRSEFHYAPFDKWFENHIYPTAEGITVFSSDITARKKAEEARRISEERYQLASRATNDVIWDWDLTTDCTDWNEAVLANFGYSPEEMGATADGWKQRVHPEDRDRVLQGIHAAIEGTSHIWQAEYRFLCKDGSYRVFFDRGFIARDPGGKAYRMIGSMLDVTQKKRAEERLEAAVVERTAELREIIADLEAFSYSISHDMRGPLRAMQGYAKALLEDARPKLNPTEQGYLDRIARSGQRLDRLIQDVLNYSRLARTEYQFETVNLNTLLEEVLREYPALQSSNVKIQVERPLLPVVGHPVLLTQCVSNLLGNAVKFVAPGRPPRVRVYTEDREGQVRLWVEDNGIGIEPHNYARVFGIFQRINPDGAFDGTGIGLAIVKKAVERMNGELGVVSETGKGSRFWIQLTKAQV